MRIRERGMGNLPFIAVLVLFIIAVVLFFLAQDKADGNLQRARDAEAARATAQEALIKAQDAYTAAISVYGFGGDELSVKDNVFPTPETIKTTFRGFVYGEAQKIAAASQTTIDTVVYQVPEEMKAKIVSAPGEPVTLGLYTPPATQETITVRDFIAPLEGAFADVKRIAEANNAKAAATKAQADARVQALEQANQTATTTYQNDVNTRQAAVDNASGRLSNVTDSLEQLTQKYNQGLSEMEEKLRDAAKEVRLAKREAEAWRQRALNEKYQRELALAEDPKDGEVVAASDRGTVWINLGRKHKVNRGMKFTVWKPAKGNVRQDVAVIRIIDVERDRAEGRLIKLMSARVPVTKGMNISNPFYAPHDTLRVYVYGNLRRYTTDVAERRLAASGVEIAKRLDDRVNVIVLGDPPITLADVEDEEDALTAQRRADLERDKRLNEVLNQAASIGAIVVTEDVLATFIDY